MARDERETTMPGPYRTYDDIPAFTADPDYAVDVAWLSIESTLEGFGEMNGLDLDPDFQRGHVWTDEQRTRYVEFVLRGGSSNRTILFNQSGWGGRGLNRGEPVVLVDGKQRLETARMFLRNEVRAFGSLYRDFEGRLDRIRYRFSFSVNSLQSRRETLQWYVDLNSGGVVHADEEIERVKDLIRKETA